MRDEDQVGGEDRANVDFKDGVIPRIGQAFLGRYAHDILMIPCLIEIEVCVIEGLENLEL